MPSQPSLSRRAILGASLLMVASCTSGPGTTPTPSPSAPTSPAAVRVVDRAQFDELRTSGQYTISPPLGAVGASAGCASGSPDGACVEAVHQRLRDTAVERGANLVLVLQSSTLQTFPPQLSMTGELYQLTPR